MLFLVQPGWTSLSVKRGFVFGQYRDMPIITARLLLTTVTIMNGKGSSKLMDATRGLCRDDEWMRKHWPEVKQATQEAAEQERQRIQDEAGADLDRLRKECSRFREDAMKVRTENHTLRSAIRIMKDEPG